jgi:hypothetical protein
MTEVRPDEADDPDVTDRSKGIHVSTRRHLKRSLPTHPGHYRSAEGSLLDS